MLSLGNATSSNVMLSLGLLNVPVSVHGVVADDKASERRIVCTLGDHEPTPIKQKMVCPECGADDRRMFDLASVVGDGLVVLPPALLTESTEAAAEYKKKLAVSVHHAEDVTDKLMPSGKSYYLNIRGAGPASDAYVLLAHTIRARADLAFMVRFTLKTSMSVFRLDTVGDSTIVLRQMGEPGLVREAPVIEGKTPEKKAVAMLGEWAEIMAEDFDPETYSNPAKPKIAAYTASQTPVTVGAPAAAGGGDLVDLVGAIEKSLAAQKLKAKPARKSAAKKPPSKTASTRSRTPRSRAS